jgi:phosphoinositide-3-kinase, regulatory subunit 4
VTVFLKNCPSEFTPCSSNRPDGQPTTVLVGHPYTVPNRISSGDHSSAGTGTGTSFDSEDLRRRLATINGSTSSIAASQPRVISTTPYPLHYPRRRLLIVTQFTVCLYHLLRHWTGQAAPRESVLSTANSATFRPLSMLQAGGDCQRLGLLRRIQLACSRRT